MKNFDVQI